MVHSPRVPLLGTIVFALSTLLCHHSVALDPSFCEIDALSVLTTQAVLYLFLRRSRSASRSCSCCFGSDLLAKYLRRVTQVQCSQSSAPSLTPVTLFFLRESDCSGFSLVATCVLVRRTFCDQPCARLWTIVLVKRSLSPATEH